VPGRLWKPLEERTCSKRQPKSSIKSARPPSDIEVLRGQVRQIEERRRRVTTALPFGLAEIDARLPAGGLALGALHEVAGGGNGAIDGAAAALFVAGIAARTRGKVLRCLDRADLFAPALAQADLKSDRSSISKAATRRRSSIALRKVCVMSGWARSLRRSRAFRCPHRGGRSNSPPKAREVSALRCVVGVARLRRPISDIDSRDAVADLRPALDAVALAGRGASAVARRARPLPGGRERGFRIGGVR